MGKTQVYRRIGATAILASALTSIAVSVASAATVKPNTVEYEGSYSTNHACAVAGHEYMQTGATGYKCTASGSRWALYVTWDD